MTVNEINSEIQKSLDRVPESVLQDIVDFLKQAENQPAARANMSRNLRIILEEDKRLLERLAK